MLFLIQPIIAQDMVPLWRRAIGGVVLGSLSAEALSTTMIVEGGIVKAYSPQGNLLWEYLANGKLLPFITRTWEGTSYVCRTNGTLIALNRIGLELWKMDIEMPLSHAVIIGWDGRIFIPMDDKIACYNNNGRPLWTKKLGGSIALPPVLDKNGGLITALTNGKLLQISAFGGIKETQLPQTPSFINALFPNENNASIEGVLVIDADGGMEVVGRGFPKQRFPRLSLTPLAIREYNGKIAIVLSNGEVLLFSNNGEKIWSTDGSVSGKEIVLLHDERGIYVLGKTRAVGFDPDGNIKWSLDIKNAAIPPVFGSEGVLYLSGSDWILYAYHMEDADTVQCDISLQNGEYGLGELPGQRANYYQFSDFSLSFQFDIIRERLSRGELGEDEPAFTILLKEAAASMRNSLSIPQSKPPVHLRQRLEAVKLLELFGSEELTLFLVDLFLGDREPLMKVASASAIGSIGVDHKGAAMEAFTQAVINVSDGRVLTSLAKAVGALCRRAGPSAMREGIPILTIISARLDAPLAQRQALAELKSLQQ
jgi:outer membrane protein assembly factor BamB